MVLRLQDKEINCDDALDVLCTPEAEYRGTYNIIELKDVLVQEPFCVEVEKDAIKLARYLIEDEQTERIIFDERTTNELRVLISIMRNLLGNYVLLSPKMVDDIQRHLVTVTSN